MAKDKSPETPQLQFNSDLDALSKLFQANQYVEQTTRDYDQAKTAKKAAEEYRDALLSGLDRYTQERREIVARQGGLVAMFDELPPWLTPGIDPDKPAEE